MEHDPEGVAVYVMVGGKMENIIRIGRKVVRMGMVDYIGITSMLMGLFWLGFALGYKSGKKDHAE